MKTNSNDMNIESADLSPTKCHEKVIIISKEEDELSETSCDGEVPESIGIDYDDNDSEKDDCEGDEDENDYDDTNDDDNALAARDNVKKIENTLCHLRKLRIDPLLFTSHPRLQKICKDGKTAFLSSCFTQCKFRSITNDSVDEIHKRTNNFKNLLNLWGFNLTSLDVSCYPTSQIMPIINASCPNLWDLALGFEEIMSQDFENCFSNMPNLEVLSIYWQCEKTLPMTLAKSLEQIGGSLKYFILSCALEVNDIFLPDSLASVFPRLIALERLNIWKFRLSQLLLRSISEMKNLNNLELTSGWLKNHSMCDTRIDMYPIGYLKNLKSLRIDCDYGITDKFLINLCNNARKLTYLSIIGTNITDIGISAIKNLKQLQDFDLGLTCNFFVPRSAKNEFITDESIQCLFNQELKSLNISNCINVTDESVLKLVKNLLNLTYLSIENTKVTREAVKEIYKLGKQSFKRVTVNYSFEIDD